MTARLAQHPVTRFIVLSVLALSCAKTEYPELYKAEPKAPSLQDGAIEALEHLGPTLIDDGVNFGVYSERAERVELLVFEDPESNQPTRQFPMTRFGDVWNVHVEGVGVGTFYGYIAWGPNWTYDPEWYCGSIHGFVADVDGQGNRFNPNKLLQDPYSKAVHRDHDWSKGSIASGPRRTDCTYAASTKSVVVKSDYQWGPDETIWRQNRQNASWAGHRWQDLIVYEVHAKGFTADPASKVQHPGTYRGFAEKADYLKDLGITAVELMPIHEKPLDGGYWGYQTLNFFAPELTYASRKKDAEVIDEFKYMVEELHKRGIEVIIDVVFNHTGEGGLWREKIEQDISYDPGLDTQLTNFDPQEVAGLYSYRGLDNNAYYALSPDGKTYWNNTGVGNQTRPNHRPMRKLILDSLRYYAEELHVDGFRFDLAPVLGEIDGQWQWAGTQGVVDTVLQEIIDDPVLRKHNTRIIAEPWSLQVYAIGGFPSGSDQQEVGWYEWNGRFRDWWREMLNCDSWTFNSSSRHGCGNTADKSLEDGGALMTGTQFLFAHNGRKPYHAVNFITVHDGFTLYDLFSYNEKRNLCGPLNPVCCDQPNSPFCDRDSGDNHNRSRDWGNEPMKRQMMRNTYAALMLSHGTPMIYGGDEWLRTQLGNNNAYSTRADNPFNWFDWGVWEAQPERHRMHDFVRNIIRFRKERGYAFAPTDYALGSAGGAMPFAWKSPQNGEPNWDSRSLMVHYYDSSRGPELAVLMNMSADQVEYTLPQGRTWKRLFDTQSYFDGDAYLEQNGLDKKRSANITLDDPLVVPGSSYGVPGRTIVVLEAGQ